MRVVLPNWSCLWTVTRIEITLKLRRVWGGKPCLNCTRKNCIPLTDTTVWNLQGFHHKNYYSITYLILCLSAKYPPSVHVAKRLLLFIQEIHPNPWQTFQVTVTSRRNHANCDGDFVFALFSAFLLITEVGKVGVGWKVDDGSAVGDACWIETVEASWRL